MFGQRKDSPKSSFLLRLNDTFEEEGEYSPKSNPFGKRPDHRTPQGAQAARKRLSLATPTPQTVGENENSAFKANLMLLNGQGAIDSATPASTGNHAARESRGVNSVRGALEDAAIKLSSVGDVLGLSPSRPAPRTGNDVDNEEEEEEEDEEWNLSAENPIFSVATTPRSNVDPSTAAQTPQRSIANPTKSPASSRTTPRSARSLPGSAVKSVAESFPRSFRVVEQPASTSAPGAAAAATAVGGFAGWMRRHRELQKAMGPDPTAVRGADAYAMTSEAAMAALSQETAQAMEKQKAANKQKISGSGILKFILLLVLLLIAAAAATMMLPASPLSFAALRNAQKLPLPQKVVASPAVPRKSSPPPVVAPKQTTLIAKTPVTQPSTRPVAATTITSAPTATPVGAAITKTPKVAVSHLIKQTPKPARPISAVPPRAATASDTEGKKAKTAAAAPAQTTTQPWSSWRNLFQKQQQPALVVSSSTKLASLEEILATIAAWMTTNPMAAVTSVAGIVFAITAAMWQNGTTTVAAILTPLRNDRGACAGQATPRSRSASRSRTVSQARSVSHPRTKKTTARKQATAAAAAAAGNETQIEATPSTSRGRSVSRSRKAGKSTSKKTPAAARRGTPKTSRRLVSGLQEISPRGRSTARRWTRSEDE